MSHTFRKPVGSIHAVAQQSHVGCSALGCRHVGFALANQLTLDVDASPALRICRRMALRKPAGGRYADGWQSVGLALENTPTTGLDGKLALEDKPTAGFQRFLLQDIPLGTKVFWWGQGGRVDKIFYIGSQLTTTCGVGTCKQNLGTAL
ncbi:uncharacterized protein PGTG_13170 [Puccinia graminis f. sp. tritici CRL 75-36-700-3]|uniref:Uncharacterized protein n=1 Tax=Puccinia graminis f. sp. tritici (strain CRL 75-36-700-3 / race SCCL) TaxID=418459 RepID=E3KR63_PUCGT|nr:uncharacterized protein PGTG_13170 [Puccinia graminis f. sp. tritici CRL 75-36-700-3]EFP86788.1 hypothetical protein PGTG_13170 [Puccinia graminis f. sp. tritici CRL 75-36-700-3]